MSVARTTSTIFWAAALVLLVAGQIVRSLPANLLLETLAGLSLILASAIGTRERRNRAWGIGFAAGFIVFSFIAGSLTSVQYGGALMNDGVDSGLLALALLSWAFGRPFRGPGYFSFIALVLFAGLRYLLTSTAPGVSPNAGPAYLGVISAVLLLATVGFALLLERRAFTAAVASVAASSSEKVSTWVADERATRASARTRSAAAQSSAVAPISEPLVEDWVNPVTPTFDLPAWNPPPARPTGPANGKATGSLLLAIGALLFNLIGRSAPAVSSVFSWIALAMLAVAIVLGFLARREIRRTKERGAGRALVGIVVGFIVFAINIALVVVIVVAASHRG